MLGIGTKVRIKSNAYGGSTDPEAIKAHGKVGRVVYLGKDGEVEVQTEDDEFELLTIDEVEEIK
jgi:hypothetical protein